MVHLAHLALLVTMVKMVTMVIQAMKATQVEKISLLLTKCIHGFIVFAGSFQAKTARMELQELMD